MQWWREQMKVINSTTGLIFAPDDVQTRRGLQRPDCVAECAVLSEPVSGSLPPLLVPVIYIFSGTKIYTQGR